MGRVGGLLGGLTSIKEKFTRRGNMVATYFAFINHKKKCSTLFN